MVSGKFTESIATCVTLHRHEEFFLTTLSIFDLYEGNKVLRAALKSNSLDYFAFELTNCNNKPLLINNKHVGDNLFG